MATLAENAASIEKLFDEVILDEHNVLYSLLKLSVMRPFKKDDFTERDVHLVVVGKESLPASDFLNYENSGMVQGVFLSAMCLKYRVTNDPNALAKARRTYQGLRKIYELSQSVAPGFFCKPWGFQTMDETSSDQYVYSMTGMDDYYELATPGEQQEIRQMIVAMANFWLEHHYDWKYYGRPLHWPEGRFISFMALAMKYGGDRRFKDELKRLMEFQARSDIPPFSSTRNVQEFKDDQGRDCIDIHPETCLSTYLSLAPALNGDSTGFIMRILHDSFVSGKDGIAEDGTVYGRQILDPSTGKYHEIPVEEAHYAPVGWVPFAGVYGPIRKGGMQSTMFAHFALAFAQLEPECGGGDIAAKILEAVGTRHLTWYEDPHGILPECLKWSADVFSCDAAANWLWCYWRLQSLKA